MFEPEVKPQKKGLQPLHLILAAALAAAVAGYLYLERRAAEPDQGTGPTLTEEAKAYLPNLALSDDTGMTAREDALGQTLLEITGSITNNGDREVAYVEVNVVFRDVNGIEIDRQRSAIVSSRNGSLPPAATQEFRMAFDSVPPEWNQTFPNLFISQIQFE